MPQLKKLQIELSARCNEHCVHCYIPHESKNHDMDYKLFRSILDQCKMLGLTEITFSGGEPMLHPKFLDAAELANRHGFKIRIFSNLTLQNEIILGELNKWQVYEVQTSIYSVDPEIHDAVTRMPGSCELTKRGIVQLSKNNIPVFISCPLTKLNKDSYLEVLAFARQLGIKSAPDTMITAQSDHNRKNLEYRLDNDEALQVIRDILENDTAYNAERFAPDYLNPNEALPCVQNICEYSICVNAQGEVLPHPGWHKVLGDLNNQTLKDIWENSPEIKKIRNISLDDFPKCGVCPDIQFCGMSLEGNANENPAGDPFIIPGHICGMAEATRKLVHAHKATKETV